MDAIYVSNNSFKVTGNKAFEFSKKRRVKCYCGADGFIYATILSSNYSDPETTVTLEESTLTSNLVKVWYSAIYPGELGNMPDHYHSGTEGDGGLITNVGAHNFLELDDAPSTYSGTEGLYAKSTGSGIEFQDLPEFSTTFLDLEDTPSTYSGTEGYFAKSTGSGISWVSGANVFTGTTSPSDSLGSVGDIYIEEGGIIHANHGVIDTSYFLDYDSETLSLSNNDKTVSCSTATSWGTARSFNGRVSGKYYVEATMDSGDTYLDVGILGPDDNISSGEAYPGSSVSGWGWIAQTSEVRNASRNVLSMGSSYTSGDIIGMAVDLDNDLLYFSKNGTWVVACGNPNTPTGGVDISSRGLIAMHLGLGSGYNTDCQITMNFGQSSFNYSVPTGYTEWQSPVDPWRVILSTSKYLTDLTDTPSTYSGTEGLYAKSTGSGVDWAEIKNNFIDLDDTPTTYSGISKNYLRTTESGLEAIDGIILEAPNGSEWLIKVTNSGILYTMEA
jgi:hypothetical protein